MLVADESPLVLKYTDRIYKDIVEANKNSNQMRKEYLLQQPELNEPDFCKIVNEGLEKEKTNSNERFIFTCELCKYRLNKKIPNTLPFEERKRLFIGSNEWNGIVRKQNNHLLENQLTEDNLQSEIDHAGILAGVEMEQQFETIKKQKVFNEEYCELVLDKGDVKYN